MTAKLCKYGCGVMLEGFDEENRKFLEARTGGLHTKERCQEAKLKLEKKNDHGNEGTYGLDHSRAVVIDAPKQEYVDHTLPPKLKLKTITDPTPEGMDSKYNKLAAEYNVKFSQYHPLGSLYTIAVYYEEKT